MAPALMPLAWFERPRSKEWHCPGLCAKPLLRPLAVVRALALARLAERGLRGRFDASLRLVWWAALASCGSLAFLVVSDTPWV